MTKARSSSRSSSKVDTNTVRRTRNGINKDNALKPVIQLKKTKKAVQKTSRPKVLNTRKITRKSSHVKEQEPVTKEESKPKQLTVIKSTKTAKSNDTNHMKNERSVVKKDNSRKKSASVEKNRPGRKRSSKDESKTSSRKTSPGKLIRRTRSKSRIEESKKTKEKPKLEKHEEKKSEEVSSVNNSIRQEKEIKDETENVEEVKKTKTIADIIRSSRGIVAELKKIYRSQRRKEKERDRSKSAKKGSPGVAKTGNKEKNSSKPRVNKNKASKGDTKTKNGSS